MRFTTIKIPGTGAIRVLNEHRSRYPATGQYPFLIGDVEELERLQEMTEFNEQDPVDITRGSLEINAIKWIAGRRAEAEDYGYGSADSEGDWPGEIPDKGSVGLHKDVLTKEIKREVYLGIAAIEKPWHLPAVLRYRAWNECPEAEVHCAFHRAWGADYGAEITGMSGDVVECAVARPPMTREAVIKLAWEQYWYCADIVDQGCGTVANLAATLLNSNYWYFWWD
jgi:hypothetical protein